MNRRTGARRGGQHCLHAGEPLGVAACSAMKQMKEGRGFVTPEPVVAHERHWTRVRQVPGSQQPGAVVRVGFHGE